MLSNLLNNAAQASGTQGTITVNIATLPASIIGGTGWLIAANGGTGATSFTTKGVLLGKWALAIFSPRSLARLTKA